MSRRRREWLWVVMTLAAGLAWGVLMAGTHWGVTIVGAVLIGIFMGWAHNRMVTP